MSNDKSCREYESCYDKIVVLRRIADRTNMDDKKVIIETSTGLQISLPVIS